MGRNPSIDDATLIVRLAEVFRVNGYEGASLAEMARHTGLKRASLYHRFPQGKPAMAKAVLDDVLRQFEAVIAPLRGEADLRGGIMEMASRLRAFYQDGRLACVLDTMTLRGAPEEVKARAAVIARAWIAAMAAQAERGGATPEEGRQRARKAFVTLEGSLVTSRVLDDLSDFEEALADLPRMLLP